MKKIQHINILDMPRDPKGVLGTTLRNTIKNLFNNFRTSKYKMELFKEVLEFSLTKVNDALKTMEENEKGAVKPAPKKKTIKKETK